MWKPHNLVYLNKYFHNIFEIHNLHKSGHHVKTWGGGGTHTSRLKLILDFFSQVGLFQKERYLDILMLITYLWNYI